MVFTPDAVAHLFRSFDASMPDAPMHSMVMCAARPLAAPSCEQVARTYGHALVNPPVQFTVVVETERGRGTQCEGLYDRDGNYVRSLQPDERRSYGRIPH